MSTPCVQRFRAWLWFLLLVVGCFFVVGCWMLVVVAAMLLLLLCCCYVVAPVGLIMSAIVLVLISYDCSDCSSLLVLAVANVCVCIDMQ